MEIEVIETSKGKHFCYSRFNEEHNGYNFCQTSHRLDAPYEPKYESLKLVRNGRTIRTGSVREVGTHAASPRFDININKREYHTELLANDFEVGDKIFITRSKAERDANIKLVEGAIDQEALEQLFEDNYWAEMMPIKWFSPN